MNEKSIALITYSSVIRDGNCYYVLPPFGRLLDGIASYFAKIYFISPEVPENSLHYKEGKSICSEKIVCNNVKVVKTHASFDNEAIIRKSLSLLCNLRLFFKIIRKSDLIYIFLPGYSGIVSCLCALKLRKPYILYVGSYWEEIAKFRIKRNKFSYFLYLLYEAIYLKLEKYSVRNAKFCFVSGRKLYDKFISMNMNVFEIVPEVQFASINCSEAEGRDISKRVNILFVGTIIQRKGINDLVKAVPFIEDAGIRINVNLAGSINPEYRGELDSLIFELSLKNKINKLGHISKVSRLKEIYMQNDIFIIPSFAEGFPRTIYEAMISGLPVIASDIDSIRVNLGSDDLASLVPVKSPQAIANAVIELCRDNELRKKRIEKGRIFAANKIQGNPEEQLIDLINKHNLLSR